MTHHIVGHLVRRGVEGFHAYTARQQDVGQLQHDAELYEKMGQEVKPEELLPVLITGLVGLLAVWSIHYTFGEVISSLAMIESPTRSAIIESDAPPPYTDAEPEKDLVAATPDVPKDVEVLLIEHKPITGKIRTAISHLSRVGGFRARWRGLRMSILYHFLHNLLTNFLVHALGFGILGEGLVYIFISLGLMRVHMAWTHAMIAYPSQKWWWTRLPSRKDCKVLFLPALVYAAAQEATMILPLAVAVALGVMGPNAHQAHMAATECPKEMLALAFRILAVPLTYGLVGLAVLLPASVTLTRIEATLLPEGEETIVSFDKAAVMGDVNPAVRGACRALFLQAWRSFDRASRWRLLKLYAKMILMQVIVAAVAIHMMVVEMWVLGPERMAVFFKSAAAQLKLMAIEAKSHGEVIVETDDLGLSH